MSRLNSLKLEVTYFPVECQEMLSRGRSCVKKMDGLETTDSRQQLEMPDTKRLLLNIQGQRMDGDC